MLSEFVYFIGEEPLPPHIHVSMQIMDLMGLMSLWSNFAKKSIPTSISSPYMSLLLNAKDCSCDPTKG